MLVASGAYETKLLIVQVKINKIKVRIFNGYGPQEPIQSQRRVEEQYQVVENYWSEVEKEVIAANEEGCLVVMEMDANAKVGEGVIKNDPNSMSHNGRILMDIVKRQNLRILNTSNKCKGLITRMRETKDRLEKSLID